MSTDVHTTLSDPKTITKLHSLLSQPWSRPLKLVLRIQCMADFALLGLSFLA